MSKGTGSKSTSPTTNRKHLEPKVIHREPFEGKVDKAHAPLVPMPAHR